MESESGRENGLRRRAKRLGLRIESSREPEAGGSDPGGYTVTDEQEGIVISGADHALSLDEVEDVLSREEERIAGTGGRPAD